MKRVWIGNIYSQYVHLTPMVEAVLHRSTFDVDLYGVSCYAKDLGNNYEIVDHNSGDTLVICEDGKIININK